MAKAIKLYTSGLVELVDVPETGRMLDWMYRQIGCSCVENVYPQGLDEPYLMVVDESGMLVDRPTINFLASWLYGTQEHGCPIVGTALVMQQVMTDDGPDIGGIPEEDAKELSSSICRKLATAVGVVSQRLGDRLSR